MKHFIYATLMCLVLPLNLTAQDDDDMYFVPKKSSKTMRTVVTYDEDDFSDQPSNPDYHIGRLRDADEYNRHGHNSAGDKVYGEIYAGNDTLYITEQDLRDSMRDEYANEDYGCTCRLVRFGGGLRNPYYWDYYYNWAYDPFFYDPFFYDPWYYGPCYYGWYGPYYGPWYRRGWYGWNSCYGWIGYHGGWGYVGWRTHYYGNYYPSYRHGGYYYSRGSYHRADGIALGRGTGGRTGGANRYGGISSQRGTRNGQLSSGPAHYNSGRGYTTGTGVRGGSGNSNRSTSSVSAERGTRSYTGSSMPSRSGSMGTTSRGGSFGGGGGFSGGGSFGGGRGGSTMGGGGRGGRGR